MKTEPSVFSIEDLEKRGREPWDGVRNHVAKNNMLAMRLGDRAFIYHSSTDPKGIAGIAEIVREAFPDPSAWDPGSKYHDPKSTPERPIWFMVDVGFVERFSRIVTLDELKRTPGLEQMPATRRGVRLSVQPVSPEEWQIVLGLAGA